jgi:hypothetical protein
MVRFSRLCQYVVDRGLMVERPHLLNLLIRHLYPSQEIVSPLSHPLIFPPRWAPPASRLQHSSCGLNERECQ